jgi:release factor glutamine methyltransferase
LIIQHCLSEAAKQLAAISEYPDLEAQVLLAYVLNQPRSYLHSYPLHTLKHKDIEHFTACVARRLDREPCAYIQGRKEFWSLDLLVSKETLIPRPETELLIETALALFPDAHSSKKAADLGTGSGAIALALAHERPLWRLLATDISEQALNIARHNAARLDLRQIVFCQGSWCEALNTGDFDLIISNPPYLSEEEWPRYAADLKFEPSAALIAGPTGFEAIIKIVQSAQHYLKPEGYLLLEHGFAQAAAVRALLRAENYERIQSIKDLAGQERLTLAQFHSI